MQVLHTVVLLDRFNFGMHTLTLSFRNMIFILTDNILYISVWYFFFTKTAHCLPFAHVCLPTQVYQYHLRSHWKGRISHNVLQMSWTDDFFCFPCKSIVVTTTL